MQPVSAVLEDRVRRELGRILSSPAFEASDRNRQFLSHVVEETLAGRADRIKAYSIATSVFGRGPDFDPLQDSIVRIEAGRLRRALESFYLKSPAASALQITIPKGTYVPRFAIGSGEPVEARMPVSHRGPRVIVRSVDQTDTGGPDVSRTLTLQLIAALTRFTELFVYGFDTSEAVVGTARDGELGLDYELVGEVTLSDTRLSGEFLLRQIGDGRYVWAHTVERRLEAPGEPSELVALCAQIAGEVASIIAQRDGIIDCQAREHAGELPLDLAAYQILVAFQDYWRTLDRNMFEPLRRDLEAAIRQDPHFAAGHACLSLLYSNAARYSHEMAAEHPRPLERAMELARKAVQLAPSSGRAYHARAVAEWFSGQPDRSLATLRLARSLNPNDPELNAELGIRSAMRLDWEVAVPLLRESYARNPLQSGQYKMGLFFHHFFTGDHESALADVEEINAPDIAHTYLAKAAALSRLGRFAQARACLDRVDVLAPGLRSRLRDDLAFRQMHPALIDTIVEAITLIDPELPRLTRRVGR